MMRYIFLLSVSLLLSACSTSNPPKTANNVSVDQYMGTWYEIAAFPNYFQKGCRCTVAKYGLEGSKISVLNRCIKNNDDYFSEADATAWLPNPQITSQLKVQFFWPFSADYWIIYVDENYQYALVGTPKRNYLWVLSREKTLDEKTYEKLLGIATKQGFDVKKLVKTEQDCAN